MTDNLPDGWLWLRIDPETWGLINCFDQEKTPEQIVKEALYSSASESTSSDRDINCPICGAQVMRHYWCIDRDCGWDSLKEERECHKKERK